MHFTKKLAAFFTVALAITATSLSYGSSFSYSYAFHNGTVVTGTLDGLLAGNLITNIANVTVTVGSYKLPGTVYVESFSSTKYVDGAATVSLDGSYNNFLFINSDFANGDGSYTGYFGSIVVPQFQSDMAQIGSPSIFGNVVDQPLNVSWSVTPVPDGCTTGAMLGMGLIGLSVCLRRRNR